MTSGGKLPKAGLVQCVWGLLCSLSSIDQERNNVSLFNVVDQINIPDAFFATGKNPKPFPFPHEIMILWRRIIDPKIDDRELKVDVTISLLDPNETVLQTILVPITFGQGGRRARSRFRMDGILLTTPGEYLYQIGYVPQGETGIQNLFTIPLEVARK